MFSIRNYYLLNNFFAKSYFSDIFSFKYGTRKWNLSIENGTKGNPFKVEAIGNKLDIKPGEEVVLKVFAPIEMYKYNELLVIDTPRLEMKGYLNEVGYNNMFHGTIY